MLIALFLALPVLLVLVFLRQPSFGKIPSVERAGRIERSPHFRNGQFQNQRPTPDLKEGVGYPRVLAEFVFGKVPGAYRLHRYRRKKTNLLTLPPDVDVLVWFGHSSYFMQVDGKKILVDPVLSGSASPVAFTTRSFPGSDVYSPDELPSIDYLFISHDHWDHLDYETIRRLRPKIGRVITGLGTGAHLERWGITPARILERDWHETVELDAGFTVTVLPGRHFFGQGLVRNKALWVSFALKTPAMTLFLGGDSGYDTHFADIGNTHGPFDLAILECGQYHPHWPYIHLMPHKVVQAAIDLKAKRLMPVHWAKFGLALHAWDDPIIRVTAEAERRTIPILTPMIGEAVALKKPGPSVAWWTGLG